MVIVISIEGVHGVGKTTVMKKLIGNCDYVFMEEGFVPSSKPKFDPQGFFLELKWVIDWFKGIEKFSKGYYDEKTGMFINKGVIITDRSPYSACVYCSKNRNIMSKSIKYIKKEFADKGIHLFTVCLTDKKEEIWKRITRRIEEEPSRKKLNESSKNWFSEINGLYEKMDFDFDINLEKCSDVVKEFKDIVSQVTLKKCKK